MTTKFDKNKLKDIVVFCLLFLATMNFYGKFFYFVFAALFFLCIIQKKLIFNQAAFIYLALSVLMALYNHTKGIFLMLNCMSYVSLYLLGYNLMFNVYQKNNIICEPKYTQKKGYYLLFTISCGSFVHYILNFIFNYGENIGRNTNDIWTGDIMAATGQAALACLMLGLSVSMIFAPPKKIYRYLGMLSIVVLFAYDLILAGRTMFVIFFVLFVVGFIYMLKVSKKTNERFKLCIGCLIVVLFLIIIFCYNIGGIQEYVLSSNLLTRFGVSSNSFSMVSSRGNSKTSYIFNMLKYPFGGLNLRSQYGYAHDLLLDGYDEYGIIGLLLLIIILILGIKELIKLIKQPTYVRGFKLAVICIYIAILLEFFVEPILTGMSWLFACYCMINGCITGINLSYSREK